MARNFRPARKDKLWSSLDAFQSTHTANGTIIGSSLAFAQSRTVLRMIGSFLVMPQNNVAAADSATLTLGIGRVSSDAAALGSTAMPDPNDQPEFPWLYWASRSLRFLITATPSTGQELAGYASVDFDIRTMRKVKAGESIAVVSQYVDVTGTPSLTLVWSGCRVLLTEG